MGSTPAEPRAGWWSFLDAAHAAHPVGRPAVSTSHALAAVLIDTVRRLRLTRLCLWRSRERYLAVRDALQTALALLVERDATVTRLERRLDALRAELRRYTAGTTSGAARMAS